MHPRHLLRLPASLGLLVCAISCSDASRTRGHDAPISGSTESPRSDGGPSAVDTTPTITQQADRDQVPSKDHVRTGPDQMFVAAEPVSASRPRQKAETRPEPGTSRQSARRQIQDAIRERHQELVRCADGFRNGLTRRLDFNATLSVVARKRRGAIRVQDVSWPPEVPQDTRACITAVLERPFVPQTDFGETVEYPICIQPGVGAR
jgi:hypothetical protein